MHLDRCFISNKLFLIISIQLTGCLIHLHTAVHISEILSDTGYYDNLMHLVLIKAVIKL